MCRILQFQCVLLSYDDAVDSIQVFFIISSSYSVYNIDAAGDSDGSGSDASAGAFAICFAPLIYPFVIWYLQCLLYSSIYTLHTHPIIL